MRKRLSCAIKTFCFMTTVLMLVSTHILWAKQEARSQQSSAGQDNFSKLVPSPLSGLLKKRMEEQPEISSQELAAYANTVLAQEGFDYEFDICEFIRDKQDPQNISEEVLRKTYPLPMTQTNGERITFQAFTDGFGGLCGECFSQIPCLRVTRHDLLVVSEGKQYLLKRPKSFGLDEMSLVDDTMKKSLRTWEVPRQSIPIGVSEDGTKLYLELGYKFEESVSRKLVLEVSETGLRIRAANEVNAQEGERIKNYPTDPKNSYLSFERFRVGDRSYIIRFTAPCT